MVEQKAKVEIEDGLCPMCGEELVYEDSDYQDNYRWYNVRCVREGCLWEGRQWDHIVFTGYTVTDPETDEAINVEPSGNAAREVRESEIFVSWKELLTAINGLRQFVLNETIEDVGLDVVIVNMGSSIAKFHEEQITVDVSGGVAYCDDPRVEIIDHDNR